MSIIKEKLSIIRVFNRFIEEAAALQLTEQLFASLERSQLKVVPVMYDIGAVKSSIETFHKALQNDLPEEKLRVCQRRVRTELEAWRENLLRRDDSIAPQSLRRFCEEVEEIPNRRFFEALARFYYHAAHHGSSQSKYDFAMTKVFSTEKVENSQRLRYLAARKDELEEEVRKLIENWSDQTPENLEGSAEASSVLGNLVDIAKTYSSLENLVGSDVFTRIRQHKADIRAVFFTPKVTASSISCNVDVGNRFNLLIAAENAQLSEYLSENNLLFPDISTFTEDKVSLEEAFEEKPFDISAEQVDFSEDHSTEELLADDQNESTEYNETIESEMNAVSSDLTDETTLNSAADTEETKFNSNNKADETSLDSDNAAFDSNAENDELMSDSEKNAERLALFSKNIETADDLNTALSDETEHLSQEQISALNFAETEDVKLEDFSANDEIKDVTNHYENEVMKDYTEENERSDNRFQTDEPPLTNFVTAVGTEDFAPMPDAQNLSFANDETRREAQENQHKTEEISDSEEIIELPCEFFLLSAENSDNAPSSEEFLHEIEIFEDFPDDLTKDEKEAFFDFGSAKADFSSSNSLQNHTENLSGENSSADLITHQTFNSNNFDDKTAENHHDHDEETINDTFSLSEDKSFSHSQNFIGDLTENSPAVAAQYLNDSDDFDVNADNKSDDFDVNADNKSDDFDVEVVDDSDNLDADDVDNSKDSISYETVSDSAALTDEPIIEPANEEKKVFQVADWEAQIGAMRAELSGEPRREVIEDYIAAQSSVDLKKIELDIFLPPAELETPDEEKSLLHKSLEIVLTANAFTEAHLVHENPLDEAEKVKAETLLDDMQSLNNELRHTTRSVEGEEKRERIKNLLLAANQLLEARLKISRLKTRAVKVETNKEDLANLFSELDEAERASDRKSPRILVREKARKSYVPQNPVKSSRPNIWLVAATILVVLLSGAIYLFSATKGNISTLGNADNVVELDPQTLNGGEYLTQIRVNNQQFVGFVKDEWNAAPEEKREEVLRNLLIDGTTRGFNQIVMISPKGEILSSANPQGVFPTN